MRTNKTALFLVLLILLGVVAFQFAGVAQDTVAGLRFRFAFDYGEGIVWQQALLMFGPRMYSSSPDLPFIAFPYPPLYYAVVRCLMQAGIDPLLAGRLVSVCASIISAGAIGTLVMLGSGRPCRLMPIAIAVVVALIFLCLNPVRVWGLLMRVDMLAIALGLVGTVVFVRSRCSAVGTTIALVICTAAVFTKQTQLPAGIAVFLIALACAPRRALVAAGIAGSVGLACAVTLELTTGGFLKNIISYNINPFDFQTGLQIIWSEREAGPLLLSMLAGCTLIVARFMRRSFWDGIRQRDVKALTQSVSALHFMLACLSALEVVKEGASENYFLDMLASGSVVLGLLACELIAYPVLLCASFIILSLTVANLRHRRLSSGYLDKASAQESELVELIAAADRPVISDDMVLVMRAGKSLVYEPAIVRVLVGGGKWDPAPLLAMIRDHGFAFAITFSDKSESGPRVTQAIEAAYPVAKQLDRNLTIHYPR